MLKKVKNIYVKLLKILTPQQKFYGMIVLLCSFVGAGLELMGVSIIVPLVNALLSPEILLQNALIREGLNFLSFLNPDNIAIYIVMIVVFIYLLKNGYFIFFAWLKAKYASKIQRECSLGMMRSYMNRGYQFFLNRNMGELFHGVGGDVSALYVIINSTFQIIIQMLICVFIYVYMCIADFQIAIGLMVASLLCVIMIFVMFKKKMVVSGKLMRRYTIKASQALIQAFYGIKEVLVMDKQSFFIDEFKINTEKKQKEQINQNIGAEIPAYIIEAFCISGILLFICVRLSSTEDAQAFVATLAAFAVGAFRVLPAIAKVSSSVNSISSSLAGFYSVCENVSEFQSYDKHQSSIDVKDKNICVKEKFEHSIDINQLYFAYNKDQKNIIENLSFSIKKGQSVALVGESGAGKTTLVDLMLGLLYPKSGSIQMDGINLHKDSVQWHHLIGYVPQSIYLTDSSIYQNVAFGQHEDEICMEKVKNALEKAELLEFVDTLPMGMDTVIGDRGVRLSGGQRQRIGIARALYHNPEILFFDEATSSLDNDTEQAVMKSIEKFQGEKTIIIVAHRLSTIKSCDIIYEVCNGKAVQRKYEDIVK